MNQIMGRWVGGILTSLLLLGSLSVAAQPADGTMVMKQHTLKDPGSGNMDSHVLLAPAGWKVEGSAWWAGPNLFRILPSQNIKVIAPDGRMVHIGPSISASDFWPSPMMQQMGMQRPPEGTIDNGRPILYMPQSPDEWRSWMQNKILPQERPGATNIRVQEVTVIPELTTMMQRQLQPIHQQIAQQNQQAQMMGDPSQSFADGAVLGFSCSYQMNGQAWEEMIILGTSFMGLDSQTGRQIWWSIEPNVSYRALAGQLQANLPLFYAISTSLQATPQWTNMKMQHIQKMGQIDRQGAADRSRIIADNHREISNIISEGYKKRTAIQDRSHEKFINYIREVDNYTTPGSTTQVQLPSHYNHVYTNNHGEYILTNDANYNPNGDQNVNSQSWNTMQPAR